MVIAHPHLERCVAVVHGVFNEKVLENAHGQLSDLGALLQGLGHLSQQQAHQEVVAAVFLRQAELQTLLCGWARQEGVSTLAWAELMLMSLWLIGTFYSNFLTPNNQSCEISVFFVKAVAS